MRPPALRPAYFAVAGPDVVGDVAAARVALVAPREDRVADAPVGADLGVVPGQPQLVRRVVVVVDEVRQQDVGVRGEAVGHAGRDVHPLVDVAVEVDHLGLAVGRRADAQVVQHDTDLAAQQVPVVRLEPVEVQPDQRAGLLLGAVALHHLAAVGEPAAAVGLDEAPSLVAVHVGTDQHDVVDHGRGDDLWHRRNGSGCPLRGRNGRSRSGRTATGCPLRPPWPPRGP